MAFESFFALVRPWQFRGKFRLLGPLVPKAGTRRASVFGANLDLDLSDAMQRLIYLGAYEREETIAVRKALKPGHTVVDVGANVGYFTALAAQRVGPAGRVVAIEPSPYAFGRLRRMLPANCTAENIGLSDAPGELALYLDASAGNHTPTMSLEAPEGAAHEYARVPVETLDDVAARLGIERIDLMKIDVEGHEPRILAGARRLCEAGKVRAVLCEFNEFWLRKVGSSSEELAATFRRYGFTDVNAHGGALVAEPNGVYSRLLVWNRG